MKEPIKQIRILLVSNNEELQTLLQKYVNDLTVAKSEEEAKKQFHSNPADIIVCDLADSLEFCKELKKQAPTVPVIFIGPKDEELLYEAINAQIDRYFLKPYDFKQLKKTLQEFETKIFMQKVKEYNTFMLHQYKNAIDSSNIVSKTDINGIITYVNDEFCKISGYTKEELLGKNHNIVRHPDVPKENFKRFWDTILSKKIWKGTVKNRAKDGTTFYVNTTVIPILDWNGDITEFVAIRYDVTNSVKLQEKLQKKEKELETLNKELEKRVEEKTKQLRELNLTLEKRVEREVTKNREKDRMMFQQARLASLGEMLGNIAHQWRQPLMELGILLYKIKKLSSDERIDEIYEKGTAILEKMSQTISDFQNFFSPDKKKERFNVAEVINNTIAIMEGVLKKSGITVTLRYEEDMEIEGYKNEFSQVILNIISNAKDALNDVNPPEKIIKLAIKSCKNYLRIDIEDNAGGIPPNIIEKIFEPYFTTKQHKKGTGLGLYMSKMIIEESMGGELGVKNGKSGAKFIIKLPLKV
ncbi:hypothetical protein NitYY0826_C1834 [Nitratiruptor sp. YY08-26]|uniref:PAS domain S-box protein n=1 Tax=unclassified Nitratiruptor TaxID=2624044 RepID=UPI0019163498|nr:MULTISPECIES: PAS domain S-box protein [unclassified Nitratiruptor]BCD62946.1 hypothetical protein NitYY0813_C1832 [Nitratiruptor sp. YY08-13]BCD66881.1 hypothetical protein NitYY0826_C1834 [Nitratiruptor sp. YY08-26]